MQECCFRTRSLSSGETVLYLKPECAGNDTDHLKIGCAHRKSRIDAEEQGKKVRMGSVDQEGALDAKGHWQKMCSVVGETVQVSQDCWGPART